MARSDARAVREKAVLMAHAAANKKALEPVLLDMAGRSVLADYFVIVSGRTEVQVRSIVNEILRICRDGKIPVARIEGQNHGKWVLIDLGDILVHVFLHTERLYYALEDLWKGAKKVKIPEL